MVTTIALILFIIFLLSVGFGLYKGYTGAKRTEWRLERSSFIKPYFSFGVNFEGFEEGQESPALGEPPLINYKEVLSVGILWVRLVWEFEK